eukprot:2690744-Pleurochrysis_carterae.AAC.1
MAPQSVDDASDRATDRAQSKRGVTGDSKPSHVHAEPRRQRGGRALGLQPEEAFSRSRSRASLSRAKATRIDASSADANGVASARKRSALACGARENDARKDSITALHVGRSSALIQVDTAPVTARARNFEQAPCVRVAEASWSE